MQKKKQDSHTATRAPSADGTYLIPRRDVGAVVQQRLHHRKMPAIGGVVQAGAPVLESSVRSAVGPQQQERPRQPAMLSRAGHPALRTRTSANILQQVHISSSRH